MQHRSLHGDNVMAVNISAGNPQLSFVVFEFVGRWTWEEYYEARRRAKDLADAVPHTVNVVADVTQSVGLPGSAISHFRSSMERNQKKFDIVVVVTQSRLMETVANALLKLGFGSKLRVVKTLPEAQNFFEEYDAKNAPIVP